MLAERLGGYVADPGDPALRRVSNHPFAQAALDPEVPVEAFVAALERSTISSISTCSRATFSTRRTRSCARPSG